MNDIGRLYPNKIIRYQTYLFFGNMILMLALYLHYGHSLDLSTTIADVASKFPCCIPFRLATLMICLTATLQFLCIKWWFEDQLQRSLGKKIFWTGLFAMISFGVFGSTIDTKRMNYQLLKTSAFFAFAFFTWTVDAINRVIKQVEQTGKKVKGKLRRRVGNYMLWSGLAVCVLVFSGSIGLQWRSLGQVVFMAGGMVYLDSFRKVLNTYELDITDHHY